MAYKQIIVDKVDSIGILTLNRPEEANGLTYQMAIEANDALQKLAKDDSVRALLIKGAGQHFCMGDDGEDAFYKKNAMEILRFLEAVSAMKNRIADYLKGVVVAAQGLSVMTGTELVALADIVVASENAKFGILGINYKGPCIPTLHTMRYALGPKKALQLMITGEHLDAEVAMKLGLVDKIVPQKKLDEAAMEAAKLLASKDPVSMAFAKRANIAIRNMSRDDAAKYVMENAAVFLSGDTTQNSMKISYANKSTKDLIKAKKY